MPKKPRVRTLMVRQDIKAFKGSESLLKCARQYFCPFFDLSKKKSARKIVFDQYLKS